MDEQQFRHALRCGLGRAILYARDHDVSAFRDCILDACLHCLAIDPVSEGTHLEYTLDLVELLPDKAFYYDALLNALPGSGDDWDAVHRFHFAAALAMDGDKRAKRAMYESFDPGPRHAEGIALSFVQLDGVRGLSLAAEKVGRLLLTRPDEVDEGWLFSFSKEHLGEQETIDALRAAGAQNPNIEAYLRVAQENENRRLADRPEKFWALSYEELKPTLRLEKPYRFSSWGYKASDENLVSAAHGLLETHDPDSKLAHLKMFTRRRFPLDHNVLLVMASTDDEAIRRAAVQALTHIEHPSVRVLAFRLVETRDECRREAIALLARNFHAGDHEIALRWFEAEDDYDVVDEMQRDLTELWELHPEPETEVRMLRAVYEKGPCSFCRECVVRELIKCDGLTDEMRAECAYDANDEVRELVTA